MTSILIGAISTILVAIVPAWLLYRRASLDSKTNEATTALEAWKDMADRVRTDAIEIEGILAGVKAELTSVSLQAHAVLTEVNWFRVVHGVPLAPSLKDFEPLDRDTRADIVRKVG